MLRLAQDEAHIWTFELSSTSAAGRLDLLSDLERDRARRFRSQWDRESYIESRAFLKELLSRYVDRAPEKIEISSFCHLCGHRTHGKPRLAVQPDSGALEFSLSRSQGLMVVAVTNGVPVGADVELVRGEVQAEAISKHFFFPAENSFLRGLDSVDLPLAFFRFWTLKEAFAKARGEGMALPFDEFWISLDPSPRLVVMPDDSDESGDWTLLEFTPKRRFAAATAVRNPRVKPIYYRW